MTLICSKYVINKCNFLNENKYEDIVPSHISLATPPHPPNLTHTHDNTAGDRKYYNTCPYLPIWVMGLNIEIYAKVISLNPITHGVFDQR